MTGLSYGLVEGADDPEVRAAEIVCPASGHEAKRAVHSPPPTQRTRSSSPTTDASSTIVLDSADALAADVGAWVAEVIE